MKITPVHDRIVVRIAKAEEKVGSLYVPENAKDRPAKGRVEAVGLGKFVEWDKTTAERESNGDVYADAVYAPMCCKVGDEILFAKYSGSPVPGDDDLRIIGNDDVFAIIEA